MIFIYAQYLKRVGTEICRDLNLYEMLRDLYEMLRDLYEMLRDLYEMLRDPLTYGVAQ